MLEHLLSPEQTIHTWCECPLGARERGSGCDWQRLTAPRRGGQTKRSQFLLHNCMWLFRLDFNSSHSRTAGRFLLWEISPKAPMTSTNNRRLFMFQPWFSSFSFVFNLFDQPGQRQTWEWNSLFDAPNMCVHRCIILSASLSFNHYSFPFPPSCLCCFFLIRSLEAASAQLVQCEASLPALSLWFWTISCRLSSDPWPTGFFLGFKWFHTYEKHIFCSIFANRAS